MRARLPERWEVSRRLVPRVEEQVAGQSLSSKFHVTQQHIIVSKTEDYMACDRRSGLEKGKGKIPDARIVEM